VKVELEIRFEQLNTATCDTSSFLQHKACHHIGLAPISVIDIYYLKAPQIFEQSI